MKAAEEDAAPRSQIMTNGAYCPKRRVAGGKCDFKKGGGGEKQCDAVRVMEEERKCCSSKEARSGRGENNADAHQLHSISAVRSEEQNKQRKNGATEQRGNQY